MEDEEKDKTTYQDHMTLGEIAEYDMEMTKDAIKNAKEYRFDSPKKAIMFLGESVKNTMAFLGVPPPYNINSHAHNVFDDLQTKKNIRIERRKRYEGAHLWRNGLYIYQDDVLVAFIGEPLVGGAPPLMPFTRPGFVVVTNARGDLTSKFYTMS